MNKPKRIYALGDKPQSINPQLKEPTASKMLLSLVQKSKSILGIGETVTTPTSSTPPVPNDLQSGPSVKSLSSMEQQSTAGADHREFQELIYDYIRSIKDPEKPATLEDLHVVYEEGVKVKGVTSGNVKIVEIEFNPTVPHCSLATLIGLCIRVQLERTVALSNPLKLDIFIKKGAHNTEEEINKQINDKERIAAAMENPNLRKIVEECIQEED
ncbi:hypothetical protein FOCC_FOCC000182 [Frankliniella occidentalis]|uniref:MIP18 family protein galla-1 n=1 Tax=Frankliniella occidentalis TaxID=133901 RepID=A0A6J1TJL0_FRAOC|nr:MIP18 family protein galla-1 [Frankliniella occidentalis]KAE8753259.1 hypothetical protein FOCC_FOCC000182 [Frankliniella occidentalis]